MTFGDIADDRGSVIDINMLTTEGLIVVPDVSSKYVYLR